ncbi:MAG: GntR family transcriptional regulator [Burkholderiales bacterium]|nr:GntR family transcriptional regulator [Burkholderiales bacterium]
MADRDNGDLATPAVPGSLWRSVNSLLAERIRDGVYAVGDRLPTEIELAQELGVSRNTVREALNHLANRGLILRRRRGGTTVLGTGEERLRYRYSIDPLAVLDGVSPTTRLQLVRHATVPLPASIRQQYPNEAPDPWMHLEILRVAQADATPLSWSDVYLHPRLAKLRPLVSKFNLSIYQLIEKKAGEPLSRIDNVVKPVLIGKRLAGHLGVPPKSLGLHLSRYVFGAAGELLEVAEAVYPHERYQIEISFEMGQKPAVGKRR